MTAKTWSYAAGWKLGDRIEDQYEIRKILLGNMGAVFLCRDVETGMPVAVKTFQKTHFETDRSREVFLREVETWIRLAPHPNIVRAYFARIIENKPYLFLEYVSSSKTRGANLKEYMTNRRFSLQETLELAMQICDGMIHASNCVPGIVHRDLKPENLLLAPDGTVKITDFGLAYSDADAPAIAPGGVPSEADIEAMADRLQGTPAYISPEQCRCGTDVDVRSDVYSFGCVLYELIARKKPFEDAGTIQENVRAHLTKMPPCLRSIAPAVPAELDRFVQDCLAKRPAHRPPDFCDCRAILGDLYTGLTGKIFTSRQPDAATVTNLVNKGVSLMDMGLMEEALKTLKEAWELDPLRAEPLNYLGVVYYRQRQYDQAVDSFRKAVFCDPNNAMSHCNLGAALEAKGVFNEAEACYKKALKTDPSLLAAAYNLSLLYQTQKRNQEALQILMKLRDLSVGGYRIEQRLAELHCRMRRYDRAIRHAEAALEKNPNNASLHLLSGKIHFLWGRDREAEKDFKTALDFDPQSAEAHYRLGLICNKRKELEQAIRHWESAVNLDPNHGPAHFNLAVALAMRRRYPIAWIHVHEAEKNGVDVSDFVKELRRISHEPGSARDGL
ncbi:MAG TPA: serine/threonine-protein kinase [bacterium]|nr:serine/threonine-protein kinase [bacterium]HQL61344.1 serine/threonine-protein kinase [bacterium]